MQVLDRKEMEEGFNFYFTGVFKFLTFLIICCILILYLIFKESSTSLYTIIKKDFYFIVFLSFSIPSILAQHPHFSISRFSISRKIEFHTRNTKTELLSAE